MKVENFWEQSRNEHAKGEYRMIKAILRYLKCKFSKGGHDFRNYKGSWYEIECVKCKTRRHINPFGPSLFH